MFRTHLESCGVYCILLHFWPSSSSFFFFDIHFTSLSRPKPRTLRSDCPPHTSKPSGSAGSALGEEPSRVRPWTRGRRPLLLPEAMRDEVHSITVIPIHAELRRRLANHHHHRSGTDPNGLDSLWVRGRTKLHRNAGVRGRSKPYLLVKEPGFLGTSSTKHHLPAVTFGSGLVSGCVPHVTWPRYRME